MRYAHFRYECVMCFIDVAVQRAAAIARSDDTFAVHGVCVCVCSVRIWDDHRICDRRTMFVCVFVCRIDLSHSGWRNANCAGDATNEFIVSSFQSFSISPARCLGLLFFLLSLASVALFHSREQKMQSNGQRMSVHHGCMLNIICKCKMQMRIGANESPDTMRFLLLLFLLVQCH